VAVSFIGGVNRTTCKGLLSLSKFSIKNLVKENLVKVMCCHYQSFSDDWSKKRREFNVYKELNGSSKYPTE